MKENSSILAAGKMLFLLQGLEYGFKNRTTDLVQPTDEHKTRANSEEKKGI